jgi:hypothetical protein
MHAVTLSRAEYRDRVYACWLGKNCGGTLGAPLERGLGQPEPFDVWWYPELREGGIPNDDLEMQLIWLKAVEERGFDLTARDLAQYWLDHIAYNWDEYGLNKTNLRLGLLPPVSGAHNNWFVDCMGSPIRSELWACMAPGVPWLAASYAYQDAIVDHAGGEGVCGEVFNAAIESAAFVLRDPQALLDVGLTYIPPDSLTARAVSAAREAHAAGHDWRGARRAVLAATPHHVAQYAPINLGFQVVGWLYGEDFGDALCKTVNCGYDTDCTGATVGSILGILWGRAGLPERWTAPLGETIATSEPTGGIKHASTGENPVPRTLDELTDRVCRLGERLLARAETTVRLDETTDLDGVSVEGLMSPSTGPRWWEASPMMLGHSLDALTVDLDYVHTPVVRLGEQKLVRAVVGNPHPEPVTVAAHLTPPPGWTATPPEPEEVAIAAGSSHPFEYRLEVAEARYLPNSARAVFSAQALGRPAQPQLPVALLGPRRWQVRGPFGAGDDGEGLVLSEPLSPDTAPGDGWREVQCGGHELGTEFHLQGGGAWYARIFLESPREEVVHMGVPANCPTKLWVNREPILETESRESIRPSLQEQGGAYADVPLRTGWNEVLVRYVRRGDDAPFDAHFVMSRLPMHDGITDIGYTRAPWEV